jgi:hypothetical protein
MRNSHDLPLVDPISTRRPAVADPGLTDLQRRLDRLLNQVHLIEAELSALRDEVAAFDGTIVPSNPAADDLSDGNLLDVSSAQERFGLPADQLRRWARETAGTEQAIGVRRGGRWLVDPRRVRARLNGG